MSDPSGNGNVLHLDYIDMNILVVIPQFCKMLPLEKAGRAYGTSLYYFLQLQGNPQLSQNKDFDLKKLPISGKKTLTSFPTRSSLFSTMPHGAIPIAQTRPLDLEEWSFKASPTWLITPVNSHGSYF